MPPQTQATIDPSPDTLSYPDYLSLQLKRSLSLKAHDPGQRATYLISQMAHFLPPATDPRILCVGCRNAHELEHLALAGYHDTIGIDLHSADPRILVMDMHTLAFPDASFDAIYAAHSLEHALDPAKVAAEFQRVLRPASLIIIEVPIRYGRRGADLWDFESPADLAALFPRCTTLWSEAGPQIEAPTQQAARAILRLEPRP